LPKAIVLMAKTGRRMQSILPSQLAQMSSSNKGTTEHLSQLAHVSFRIPPTHACRLPGRAELSPIVMSKLERIEKAYI